MCSLSENGKALEETGLFGEKEEREVIPLMISDRQSGKYVKWTGS